MTKVLPTLAETKWAPREAFVLSCAGVRWRLVANRHGFVPRALKERG